MAIPPARRPTTSRSRRPTPATAKRPTISDVAALAGVSKGAVSRSFNGGERISAATVARIQAAASELGWVPSAAARAINGAPAQAIGLVLRRPPELLELDPFFPAFLAGVESVLAQHANAAIIRFVDSAREERECYRKMVAERRVDGFLLSDLRRFENRYRILTELEAKAVIVGQPGPRCPFPSVDSDSDAAVRELINLLIEGGHRRIAHVMGAPELTHARHRRLLWEETLRSHGIETTLLAHGNFVAAGGATATQELLDREVPPTAIFYGNDIMAVAGLAVLRERGLRVPHDVAVVGFDDISLSGYTSPALATVHCDYQGLGRVAAELLLTMINGQQPAHRTLIPVRALPRGSISVEPV